MGLARPNEQPVYDEKVNQILRGLTEGKTREQVAQELGYKNYKSMDMYLRRRNFVWDRRKQTYVPANTKIRPTDLDDGANVPAKVAKILSLFKEEGADAQTIAKQVGFENHRELAQYMRAKGYRWSGEVGNYVKDSVVELEEAPPERTETPVTQEAAGEGNLLEMLERYLPLLRMLEHNKDKLVDLFMNSSDVGRIPRYVIPGVLTTKSIHMSHLLDRLSREFSREKNISQRDLFEVALVEFFKRYGYEHEIDKLLQQK